MKIVLDAMGGDYCPENAIAGLAQAIDTYDDIERFLLTGKTEEIEPLLEKYQISGHEKIEIVEASQVVEMSDPSTIALRQKKDSSITVGSRLLKEGRGEALVSAGHTGATVSSMVVQNRMLPGIDRPAIATVIPGKQKQFLALDVGATVDCKPVNLAQYAILGEAYSLHVLKVENPRIGLLSVGAEDGKGNELIKKSFDLVSQLPVNFVGNIEGNHLFDGEVDVVLCDGFVGNVMLKTAEGIANTIGKLMKERLMATPVRKAGALLSQGAFKELKELTDHEEYGGAPLLGVNGTCIIGHGSSSPKAVKNAIRVASEMVRNKVNEYISEKISSVDWQALEKNES